MKKYYLLLSVLSCFTSGTFAQYTILHSFNGTDGAFPVSTLAISGKTLFGTTTSDGAYDSGCIFSIDTNGANYKDIHDFSRRNSNGATPYEVTLQISSKHLFGMTEYGGVNDSGCVFSVDTDGANYKDLYDFNTATGSEPLGGVTLNGTRLFGMTLYGGANGFGCIFSMDTNGSNFKKLWDFTGTDGANPYGVVTVLRNKLYGIASFGGANGDGDLFSLDSNGTNFTDMFDFNVNNGQYPNNLLTLSKGQFFGMTFQGAGGSLGNVFSIDTNGSAFKDLLDFQGMTAPLGANPSGDLTLIGNYLYGMTEGGGASDSGCIFSVDTAGNNYADLYDFDGPHGSVPYADLTVSGGFMYGTTLAGGANQYGVVFRLKIPPAGVNNISNAMSSVKLYPNPSKGQFNLSIRNYELGINSAIEVYNELGEKVYSEKLNSGHTTFSIDLNSEPAGIYFYRLLNESRDLVSEGKMVIVK